MLLWIDTLPCVYIFRGINFYEQTGFYNNPPILIRNNIECFWIQVLSNKFFSNILSKWYFTKNEMLNICTTRFLLPTIGILYCYTQATCFTILINSATTIDVPKFFRCPLHKKLYTHNWIKEGNINTSEKKSHYTHN